MGVTADGTTTTTPAPFGAPGMDHGSDAVEELHDFFLVVPFLFSFSFSFAFSLFFF